MGKERELIKQLTAELQQARADKDALQMRVAVQEAELEAQRREQDALLQPDRLETVVSEEYAGNVPKLRSFLCSMQRVVGAAQRSLDQSVEAAPATSRAGYLRSLPELIGTPVLGRDWQDEWVPLRAEYYKLSGQPQFASEAVVRQKFTIDRTKISFRASIDDMVGRGWPRERAETYELLRSCANALGRALRERDPCYSASTYALCDALFTHHREQRSRDADEPPRLYAHLRGRHSLIEKEPAWERLEVPPTRPLHTPLHT